MYHHHPQQANDNCACPLQRYFVDGTRNCFIKSQTGSGKTLAYLLPVVHKLQQMSPPPSRSDGTFALILAPTRELCSQIHEVLATLTKPFIWLVPGCISGGERRKSEKARLRKGVTILVASPGRLLDHLKTTDSFRRPVRYLVMDEVDRLLDMGFSDQIRQILDMLIVDPGLSQTLGRGPVQIILASATITDAVKAILTENVGDHLVVDADEAPARSPGDGTLHDGPGGGASEPSRPSYEIPEQLAQHSMSVTYKLRLPALVATLRHCARTRAKVVLFVGTTAGVDFLEALFRRCPWPDRPEPAGGGEGDDASADNGAPPRHAAALFDGWPLYRLHGNVPQKERLATYNAFRPLATGLLICTDVAARGLDLPRVDWILQYDAPTEISDYVHRIGRTARRGNAGSSLIFLSPGEGTFVDVMASHGIRMSPLSLEAAFDRAFKGKGGPPVTPLTLHERLESVVTKSPQLHEAALKAFQGFVRAYSTHAGELRAVFQVRTLHLGHVARSFSLHDAPRTIKQVMPAQKKSSQKDKKRPSKDDGPGDSFPKKVKKGTYTRLGLGANDI